jgi:hypothetical protein
VHIELAVMLDKPAVVEAVDVDDTDRNLGTGWGELSEVSEVGADKSAAGDESVVVNERVFDDVPAVGETAVEHLLATSPLGQSHRWRAADLNDQVRREEFADLRPVLGVERGVQAFADSLDFVAVLGHGWSVSAHVRESVLAKGGAAGEAEHAADAGASDGIGISGP